MTPEAQTTTDRTARLLWLGAFVVMVAAATGGGIYVFNSRVVDPDPVVAALAPADTTTVDRPLELDGPAPRTTEPYGGYGTWVDVFDYDPAYNTPTIAADEFAEMARLGVTTVYLQAARLDDRTPDGLVDPWLLSALLLAAHAEGLDVVAWYLPRFGEGSADLDRLRLMADFKVLGQRFDGVAVDVEWIGDGVDDETRTERLLELSAGVRAAVGTDPLGVIVPPPVQIEVINPAFWPGFPWAGLAETYDVWLPMSYWSFRSDSSGYGEGYSYHEESVRRLRDNVGDPEALVHGIGGIGGLDGIDDPVESPEPLATVEEIERFVVALEDTGSIGGSIYDWNTLEPAVRDRLAEIFAPD
jgi:hypothetical protein